MRVARIAGPAPDRTDRTILLAHLFLKRLDITVKFEAFKLGTHDYIDDTGHGIRAV